MMTYLDGVQVLVEFLQAHGPATMTECQEALAAKGASRIGQTEIVGFAINRKHLRLVRPKAGPITFAIGRVPLA